MNYYYNNCCPCTCKCCNGAFDFSCVCGNPFANSGCGCGRLFN